MLSNICLYKTDDSNTTLFFRTCEQADEKTIDSLLNKLHKDLVAIQFVFNRHTRYLDVWYREPVLVAFGSHDVAAVRQMAVGLEARHAEMRGRRGLVVLLKEHTDHAEALWLSACRDGADRRIAAIVDRIYENGGEMKWFEPQGDQRLTIFELMARRGFSRVWSRLCQFYGSVLLQPKDYAKQLLDLCQYQENTQTAETEGSARIAQFENWCSNARRIGWHRMLPETNYVEVLEKALTMDYPNFVDMFLNLAKLEKARLGVTYDKACYDLFNTSCPDGSALIDRAFKNPDQKVPLQLLELVADLRAYSEWRGPIIKLFAHILLPHDDQVRLMNRFGVFLQDTHDFQLLPQLISNNWLSAVRHIAYQDRRRMHSLSAAVQEELMGRCIERSFLAMLHFMLYEWNVPTQDRLNLLMIKFVGCQNIKHEELLYEKWKPKQWQNGRLADVMCSALRNRRLDNYRCLNAFCKSNDVDVKSLVDSRGENLLFCSIFNKIPILIDDMRMRYWQKFEMRDTIVSDQSDQLTSFNNVKQTSVLESNLNSIFMELLAANVNVHHVNKIGQNLAHLAVRHSNLHILISLVRHGVNMQLPDIAGNRPMHYALCPFLINSLPRQDLRAPNHRQETPLLHYMSQHRQGQSDQLIKHFLRFGSDPAARAPSCGNGLHLVEKSAELVRVFMQAGCDVNERNERGETAVHLAMAIPKPFEVRRLLLGHPYANLLSTNGKVEESVLRELMALGDAEMNQLLPVLNAAQMNQLFVANCQLLYNSKRPANSYCRRRLMEMQELYVLAGDFPDSRHYDQQGRVLLELGANVGVRSRKQPIDWSRQEAAVADGNGRLEFLAELRVLIEWGLDMTVVNSDGANAMDWYVSHMRAGSKESVQVQALLLMAGFDYRNPRTCLEKTFFKCLYEWDEVTDEGILIDEDSD